MVDREPCRCGQAGCEHCDPDNTEDMFTETMRADGFPKQCPKPRSRSLLKARK